ncbi:MAG: hypothetical protein IPP57_18060 [Candidatus Obscuribacter sp.]|nr:hypothetical protein [Candidatus Obscuribacter sp.]
MTCEQDAFKKLIDTIQLSLRTFDLMCHLEPFCIAVLLPEKNREEASALVQRLTERCIENIDVAPELADVAPLSVFAVSYPEDGKLLEQLLTAALLTK